MFSTVVKELDRAMVKVAEDCFWKSFKGRKKTFVLIVGPVLCVTLLILALGKHRQIS